MARPNKSACVCQIVLTSRRFDIEIDSVLGVAYMLLQAPVAVSHTAHVIVLGNEKGGSGKSTTAMHVAKVDVPAPDRIGFGGRSLLNVHAALRREQNERLARVRIGQDGRIEFMRDVRLFLD